MNINTSNDITKLSVQVTFDLSNALPQVLIANESAGTDLASCTWWYKIISPSGTIIHEGSEGDPDMTGNWTSETDNSAWPRPYNQIEFSGANYSFQIWVKDGNGNIYTDAPQTASICRPAGNTPSSKNAFGVAASTVSVKCSEARIFFQDTTYHSYKGSEGEQIDSVLKVIYPIDETATIPTPFSIEDYSTALVPIAYSSNNYQFFQYTIYDYDLGNNTFVRIKYQTIQTFSVWCNVDLEPLVCEFNKLIDEVNNGSCTDVAAANQKLNLISSKMFLVFMGIMQPLTGIDVPKLIEEIKVIGGFDCNCCTAATGIVPTTSSIIDGYNFIINPVCGDIDGTVTVNGTNITFNLQDVSYVFNIFNESPSDITAFSVVPDLDGCQKTYGLNINGPQLAEDILNIITNDVNLVNLFNTIVTNDVGNFTLLVNGKCIIDTAASCDYSFTTPIVSGSQYILKKVIVNGVIYPYNVSFNTLPGSLVALALAFTVLNKGTFSVSNSGGFFTVTSDDNPNDITAIVITNPANQEVYLSMTKGCVGTAEVSANEVVQALIDYMCALTDVQVATSQDYSICYIDPATQTKKIVTVSSGAALTDFLIELLVRGCNTIDYIIGLSAVTCTNIKALFPQNSAKMQQTDYVLGTKVGDCARIYPIELGTSILQLGIYNSDFMNALCAALELCAGGKMCDPFEYLYLTFIEGGSPSETLYLTPFITQITSADFTDATHYDNPDLVEGSPNPEVKVYWNDVARFIYDGTDGTPLEWEMTATGINILIPGFDATTNDYNFMIFIDSSVNTSQGTFSGEIVVNFAHPTAISYIIRYARIDNTNTPQYITIPNVLSSPYTISNLNDGQYTVCITPVYADGRKCTEVCLTTPACTGINSFSAAMGGSPADDFVITYSALFGLPKIKVNINYPNGGTWSQIYVNDGNDITITPPPNVYGDFYLTISPVCNEETGFIGAPTAPVILTIEAPGEGTASVNILGNNPVTICSASSTTLYTGGAFAIGSILYSDAALLIPVTGYSYVVHGHTIYSVNSSTGQVVGTAGSCLTPGTTGTASVVDCDNGNRINAIRFNTVAATVSGSSYPIYEGESKIVTIGNAAINGVLAIDITGHTGGTDTRIEVVDGNGLYQCQPVTGNVTLTFNSVSIINGASFSISIICGGICN